MEVRKVREADEGEGEEERAGKGDETEEGIMMALLFL